MRLGFRNGFVHCLLMFLICSSHESLFAQTDETIGVITRSSNLSAALPASDWAGVESAVDSGLRWLASQQGEDGRFPSDEAGQPAVTSLAVMAFLSRGHLPDQGPYGQNISRAIDFVLDTQRQRGYFSLLRYCRRSNTCAPAKL